MAIGSNTLGLLFKIGVDSGDVQKNLTETQRLLASIDLAKEIKQWNDELKKSTDLTDEQRAAIAAEIVELKKYKESLDAASKGHQQIDDGLKQVRSSASATITQFNQLRRGIEEAFSGDALEGTISLTRSLGPLGIAIGGVAVAAAGVALAIKAIVDAAGEIGTKTKDDFDALQEKIKSAGLEITKTQRDIAQAVVGGVDEISGATTALFASIIETAGPALIALFKEITGVIKDVLIPQAKNFGSVLVEGIARAIAAWRTFKEELKNPPEIAQQQSFWRNLAQTIFPPMIAIDVQKAATKESASYAENLAKVHDEILAIAKDIPSATFDPKTVKAPDVKEAQARAKATLDEVLRNAKEEKAIVESNLQDQLIDRDQAAEQIIAIEQRIARARLVSVEAEKQIDLTRAKNQQDRNAAEIKAADETANVISELYVSTTDLLTATEKKNEEASKQLQNEWHNLSKSAISVMDQINEFWFKESQQINKSIQDTVTLKDLPGDVTQSRLIIAGIQGQVEALDPLTRAWRETKLAFSDFLEKVTAGVEPIQLLTDGLLAVAGALQKTFENFILTGQLGGQAIKSLTATILAQLAIQAFWMVLKEHAKATEETAEALSDLAFGDYTGFLLHSLAASAHQKAALTWGLIGGGAAAAGIGIGLAGGLGGGAKQAATGGQFGGTGQPPGTVTINQGQAIASLGIAVDNLNNKISSMSPGDVVTVGSQQNPSAIGQANNEAARRDGTVSRQFLEIAGLRPA